MHCHRIRRITIGCNVSTSTPQADDFAANRQITAKPKGKPRGRPWKKGQSGNPSGRPKDVFGIAELARSFSTEAIEKPVELMRDKTMPRRAVIAAIDSILDRGLGKPMQPMQQQQPGADGQPVSPVFNVNVSQYAEPEAPREAATGGACGSGGPPGKRNGQ